MALFPFLEKLSVYVPVIKAAIMGRGFHCSFLDWDQKWSRQAHFNGNICFKERPQKRLISENINYSLALVMGAQPLALFDFL